MAGLALLCLLGGLMPYWLLRLAGPAIRAMDPSAAEALAGQGADPSWLGFMAMAPLACVLAACLLSRWQSRGPQGKSATWGCGFALPTNRMSYRAESYAELPQSAMFCDYLAPPPKDGRPLGFFPETRRFAFTAPDPVLARVFKPFFTWAAGICSGFRGLQAGQLHLYLLYIFAATILLLLWAWMG